VTAILTAVSHTFALGFSRQLASNPNISTLLGTTPQLVVQPIAFTIDDLRPFDVPVYALGSVPDIRHPLS
jgi:hypothetical protein